jgi:hypothetical protein
VPNLFLEAFEARRSDKIGKAVFATLTQGEQLSRYRRVGDPSFQATFERIFSFDQEILGVTGQDRILSLLNSFFFPNSDETCDQIRGVTPLPNPNSDEIGIACRCVCLSDKSFDVLIQTGLEAQRSGLLFSHTSARISANEGRSVVVLGFLNHEAREDEDELSWRMIVYDDMPEEIRGQVEVHCVILSKAAAALKANEVIQVDGKELGEVGRAWVKLLSMRYWASKDGEMYMVPKSSVSDGAINSALRILEYVTEQEVKDYEVEEKQARKALHAWRKESLKEGIEQGMEEARFRIAKELIRGLGSVIAARAMEMSVEDLAKLIRSRQSASIPEIGYKGYKTFRPTQELEGGARRKRAASRPRNSDTRPDGCSLVTSPPAGL